MIAYFVEYRLGERKILNRIHAKVGDRNSCTLGGLFTIKVEMGDDRLASQDVYGWWIAGGISKRAIGIST